MATKAELQAELDELGVEYVTRDTKEDLERMLKNAQRRSSTKRKKVQKKSDNYTHIDRSNGTLLRTSDLDKKKPWLSPVSGQATVEELTDEEREAL